jgi:hypothetical protein
VYRTPILLSAGGEVVLATVHTRLPTRSVGELICDLIRSTVRLMSRPAGRHVTPAPNAATPVPTNDLPGGSRGPFAIEMVTAVADPASQDDFGRLESGPTLQV